MKHREVRLPPDGKRLSGGRVLGVHADEVIGVHDGVNESIQDNSEVNVTVIEYIGVKPVKEENGNMVVDMQERQLPPLLSQDNKDSIPKVPNFGDVEHPQKIGNGRVISIVSHTWSKRVSVAIGQETSFNCHVCAKHDLRNIVDKFDRVGINCRQRLHDLGSNDDKQEVCKRNAECGSKVRQKPSLLNNVVRKHKV